MITEQDLAIAAATVRGEARGEPHEGRVAVAHVLLNRYRLRYRRASTLAACCLDPWQFSCWNPDDGNLAKIRALEFDELAAACYAAVIEALRTDDTTRGSLHYKTARARPRWARGKRPAVVIGHHEFYNAIDTRRPRRGVRAGELLQTAADRGGF